jgi:hypothetical protein
MRSTLLLIVVALLPASMALAEQSSRQKSAKPTTSSRLLATKGASTGSTCAAFGPGFAKVDGTETCVKIGGAVSVGVGSSSGWR